MTPAPERRCALVRAGCGRCGTGCGRLPPARGLSGLIGDRDLFSDDTWAEDLARLEVPVLILLGELDPELDGDDLAWWRDRLPASAEFRRVEGSASLTIADAWESVLEHVAPAHGHIQQQYRD